MCADTSSKTLPALISLVSHPRIQDITYICSDKFLVGRGYEATLKILDPAISRKHCTLEKDVSNGWTITSHSRNPVEINNAPLFMDQCKSLKCGDKISIAGYFSFVFKCNPDRNKDCCCDKTQTNIDVVDLANEESEEKRSSIVSLSSNSSVLSTNTNTNTTQCVVLVDKTSSSAESIEVDDSTILQKSSDVLEQAVQRRSEANELDEIYKKLKDRLNLLEQLNVLNDQLNENSDQLNENTAVAPKKASSSTTENLISRFIENEWKNKLINLGENDKERVNALREEQRKLLSNLLLNRPRHSSSSHDCSTGSVEEEEKPVVESVSEIAISTDKPVGENKLKDELKTYKQNSEWQDARIQYLEMKLRERNELELQLKSAKEETDSLQTQIGDMRAKLSKVEVLELEVTYLKERSKYQEDDKRDKDELENRIQTLKQSVQKSREEVEIITTAKSILENEMMSLRQKCEEIEKKLNTKVGCSSNEATGEYCCDLFSSFRDSVLEALEKEFTCCICNEMFVGATVTNCNHVFCTYCLKEWKKKKKQCPFCRAALTSEHRANVIDECIMNLLKIISTKMLAERTQMIEDRKSTGAPPPAKRVRRSRMNLVRSPQAVPLHLRNLQYGGTGALNIPLAHQNFVIDLINFD